MRYFSLDNDLLVIKSEDYFKNQDETLKEVRFEDTDAELCSCTHAHALYDEEHTLASKLFSQDACDYDGTSLCLFITSLLALMGLSRRCKHCTGPWSSNSIVEFKLGSHFSSLCRVTGAAR